VDVGGGCDSKRDKKVIEMTGKYKFYIKDYYVNTPPELSTGIIVKILDNGEGISLNLKCVPEPKQTLPQFIKTEDNKIIITDFTEFIKWIIENEGIVIHTQNGVFVFSLDKNEPNQNTSD